MEAILCFLLLHRPEVAAAQEAKTALLTLVIAVAREVAAQELEQGALEILQALLHHKEIVEVQLI